MKRLAVILVPVVLIGFLVVRQLQAKKADEAEAAQQRVARAQAPPRVATATARRRDIVNTFEATGVLEAPLNVKISPKVTGRVDFLEAHVGDHVKRGQVLVRIDPTNIEAQVRQQEAALAEAQYRLAQAQATQTSVGVSVESQVRQQAAAVASAQASYNQARQSAATQIAAAEANVADMQAKVDNAAASISNAQAGVPSAKATLSHANTKHDRLKFLVARGGVSQQEVDDAVMAVSMAQSAVEVSQGQLRSATAVRNSALAQKRAAEQQARTVRTKTTADTEAARQQVIQARALLASARANTSQKSAYSQSLAALSSSVDMARAAVASARANRADTVLAAPMDGSVTERDADPGSLASPGQPILALASFRQIWVSVSVPDNIRETVQLGSDVTVRFDALPGQTFTASVVQVSPSADPQARQFTVRATLDNSADQFKPGMFAHVAIETQRADQVVAVPREALQKDPQGDFVTAVVGKLVQHRPVKTGASDGAFTAITEGLRAGEVVVTMSSRRLKDGQEVMVGGGEDAGGKSRGARGAGGKPGGAEGPGGPGGSKGADAPAGGSPPAKGPTAP